MSFFTKIKKEKNFDKAKDKNRLKYTFIITPNSDAKTHNFTLSAFLLKSMVFVFGLVLVVAMLLTVSYVGLRSDYKQSQKDLAAIKEIARNQQEQLSDMNELAKDVEQQLLYLNLLETKINTLIDEAESNTTSDAELTSPELKEINANIQKIENSIASLGGTTVSTPGYYYIDDPVSAYNLAESIYRINTVFASMNIDIEDETNTVTEIQETIDSKDDYAECYPDFFPIPSGYYYFVSDYFGYRTSPYVGFHAAIDLAGRVNTPVLSAGKGVVEYVGFYGDRGNYIIVNHGYGLKTGYAHLNSMLVSVGDKVDKGELIGLLGTTGYSTGYHLHFEVMENGVRVNPLKFVSLD